MASSDPDSPSKKRKHHSARRDPPLFASRRPRPSLQQPPEFLTESINTSRNTSYIPSPIPSPGKSPTRESFRPRPRQAVDRKELTKTARKNTPNVSNENLSPRLSTSPVRLARESDRRPTSGQSSDRTQSPTHPSTHSKSPANIRVPSRTPSPTRGRSTVAESPVNSESSPGRGYAEAYQRIVEEENLAQEDSIDDAEAEDFASAGEGATSELDRLRPKYRHKSSSPRSVRTSRKPSPRVSMINGSAVDEMERENGSVNEESASDNAATENETQTSGGSGSSQYARDLQRLNNALKSNGQPFSRARVGQKSGSTPQNLRRSNGSDESLGSAFSSGSVSHQGSDPSVNVPKAWARRARPEKDWLSRINSRSGKFTGDPHKRSPSGDQLIAQSQMRASEQFSERSVAERDARFRRSSSLVNGSPSESTPRTTFKPNAISEKKPQWILNEEEFTGRSLQVSESPPLRIRNTTQHDKQNRETDGVGGRQTRGLELDESQTHDQNPQLLPFEIRRSPASAVPDRQLSDGNSGSDGVGENDSQTEDGTIEERQGPAEEDSNSVHEVVGEPIPDTPIVVFRQSEDFKQTSGGANVRHGESDHLLRRLARVSSQSPSPAKELNEQSATAPRSTRSAATPQPSKSKLNEKTPVVTGAWIDQTPGQTSQRPESKGPLQTPFVSGGWIDTPLPTGARGPPMPTPSDPEEAQQLGANKNVGASELVTKLNATTPRPQLKAQEPLKYTGPPLPKSALEEIINEARSEKLKYNRADPDSDEEPTLNLGDSTIQSLEDLIANDTDYSTLLATSQETSPPSSDPSPSSSKVQPKPPQDPQSYTQLLTRLRNLGPSIRASTRQLASLERTVATTSNSDPDANEEECHEGGELHDFIWPCPRCNCPGRPTNTADNNPNALFPTTSFLLTIPALWHWPASSYRPRLTWLGFLCLSTYAYLVLENWAQMTYCHQFYAYTMEGYGVDINAPRPPFVLFKVLWGKTGLEGVLEPLYILGRTVVRIVVGIVGWLVGFFGGGGETGGGVKQPVSRDERIPRPSWGPDLSMFEDEFL